MAPGPWIPPEVEVRVSIRSIASRGIAFRSPWSNSPWPVGRFGIRRPSTSTRVRCGPNPRRLITERVDPLPALRSWLGARISTLAGSRLRRNISMLSLCAVSMSRRVATL